MRAIDTNVLARYLTGDDPEQSARARAVIDGREVFVPTTVFLESEWVLRGVYGFSRTDVCRALRAFAGLPGVSVENPPVLAEALDRAEAGMDFADALHLGAAGHCEAMLTFDRKFIKAGAKASLKVEEP
ncbi:type II toxin-antitoxin system VapC family toxin [Azospirillum sp. YIM B02556]|uniref:Type II toxin-antitoxin system VapC family toxin n=1 Tax=Azospirillum endophyticum TaxID=2800326 RepID=A0ABS1FAX3_9PROT|nr:type II toxin-antitoxin system VapC family toxin [Azospirillum endophyticum]MBK1840578.1 type II toxin-antitoxin system VapC family toxin [Azospirillum endophyticum]